MHASRLFKQSIHNVFFTRDAKQAWGALIVDGGAPIAIGGANESIAAAIIRTQIEW